MQTPPEDCHWQASRLERRLAAMTQVCRIWKNQVSAGHDSFRTMETIVHEIESRRHRQSRSPMLHESIQALLCHVCEQTQPGIRAVCAAEGRTNECWLIGMLD